MRKTLLSLTKPLFSTILFFFAAGSAEAQWTQIGSGTDIAPGITQNNQVATFGSTIYATYSDYTNDTRFRLRKYENGAWTNLSSDAFNRATFENIAIDRNGVVYVSYREAGVTARSASVQKYENGTFSYVGGRNMSGSVGVAEHSLAVGIDNSLYIAYGGAPSGTPATVQNIIVKKYNTTSLVWDDISYNLSNTGIITSNNFGISLTVDSATNNLYLAHRELDGTVQKLTVRKLNATTNNWDVLGSSKFSTGEPRSIDLYARNDKVYVAYSDMGLTTPRVQVKMFDGTTQGADWVSYGTGTISNYAGITTSLDMDKNGVLYAGFVDQGASSNGTFYPKLMQVYGVNGAWTEVKTESSTLPQEAAVFTSIAINKNNEPAMFYSAGTATSNVPKVYTFPASTLPVSLSSFSAKAESNKVKISWATKSESNSDKFIVEKSTDGKTFSELASVKSKGASSYSVYDNAPASGTNYYRLTQVDLDGKVSDKGIVSAKFGVSAAALSVVAYPVPSSGDLKVNVSNASSSTAQFAIHSIAGNIVKRGTVQTGSAATIDISALAPGKYILKVVSGSESKTASIVKL